MVRPLRRGFVVMSGLAVVAACAGQAAPPPPKPVVAVAPDAGPPVEKAGRACKAFTPPPPPAPAASDETPTDYDPYFRRLKPTHASDTCETAVSNLERAEKHITSAAGGPLAAHVAWDRKSPPLRLDAVARRLSLTKSERDGLAKNGFVAIDESYRSYAWAYHEIFQSELPVWISVDSILHAVYATNDTYIKDLEAGELVPLLARVLSDLQCALPAAAHDYPPEIAHDVDVYLGVARALLADSREEPTVLGNDDDAQRLFALAHEAKGLGEVDIFGRHRWVDWSAYEPRGHYAEAQDDSGAQGPLAAYFRAAMWLSRMEFNLVSRSSRSSLQGSPDPSETPREAIVALALSDLVERAHVTQDVAKLDRVWTVLAGRREDVSVGDMLALRQQAHVAKIELAAYEPLKRAIGDRFQRTARTHPMPEGAKVLPAIATFLGPRVVADTAAFRPLVHTEILDRHLVRAGDVAYVLGLDRGKHYLKDDLAKHPTLAAQLDVSRKIVNDAKDGGDLYFAWLGAIRAVAEKPKGVVPSFMDAPAWDDAKMNSIVAGYGQIRHNYVLMAAGSYDEGGCEIPDGWVEPNPAAFEAIVTYTERAAQVDRALHPDTKSSGPFAGLHDVARILATIARHETEGRALTDDEKRFLSMVAEMTPGSTGSAPTYTGWYFDLFPSREKQALDDASFVADYHTSTQLGKVQYAGVRAPALGVFVVDTGGPPRVMVGPIARAYELTGDLAKRYTDQSVADVDDAQKKAPWAASYTGATRHAPKLVVAASAPYGADGKPAKTMRVLVKAGEDLPSVTIEALDHHRRPLASSTRRAAAGPSFVFDMPHPAGTEGIRVKVGDWAALDFWTVGEEVSVQSGGVEIDYEKDWPKLRR